MQLIEPRAPLDSLDLAERAASGSTGLGLRSLLWALVVLGALLGYAAWRPPDFDESLPLRWLRVAADHPIRTGLALWLLFRALLPGSVLGIEAPSREDRGDGTGSRGTGLPTGRATERTPRSAAIVATPEVHRARPLPPSDPGSSAPGGGKLVVNPYDA